jgi:hypothetical protein
MRFPTAFFRYHTTKGTVPAGAANTTIGSDSAPSPTANGATPPTYPPVLPQTTLDNLLIVPNVTNQGFAPQKIAVAYGWVGSGAAPATTASLYVLEQVTGLWYLVGTAGTNLVAGGLAFFDALSMGDGPAFGGGQVPGYSYSLATAGRATAQNYLIVPACASPTTGQWYFAAAAILTTSP